ncbi:MAG TPA: hypothetical protein VF310_15240 [Vicinamibacteria bacterium]
MKKMLLLAVIPALVAAVPASAQTVSYRSVSYDCPSWYMCALYAGCASTSDRVVGGGTQTDGWQWQMTTVQSLPATPNYWFGQMANTSPNTIRMTVWAVCLSGPGVSGAAAPAAKAVKTPAPKVEPIQ